MSKPAVQIRFVGLLASTRAEVLARACISGLDALYGEIAHWDVCLQPPMAPWVSSGYAVRVQARLHDGSLLSIRAQGDGLEATVRDAFEGIDELMGQESGAPARARSPWLPAIAGRQPSVLN
jgi:hypothetical protein